MKYPLSISQLFYTALSAVVAIAFFLAPLPVFAEVVPIAPLPTNFGNNNDTLGGYINTIFFTVIAAAAVLAVLRIVWGGFQYMTSEAVTQTKDARVIITMAIVGLILLLSSWLILSVINPALTRLDALDLSFTPLEDVGTQFDFRVAGDDDIPITADDFATSEDIRFTNGSGQEFVGSYVDSTNMSTAQKAEYSQACRREGKQVQETLSRTCRNKSTGEDRTASLARGTIVGDIPLVGGILEGTAQQAGTLCGPNEEFVSKQTTLSCTRRADN